MKSFTTNLQATVQTSYANNGATTVLGREFQKTLNSQKVIGCPLNQWVDLFQLYGQFPIDMYWNPNTGHLFVLSSTAAAATALNVYVMLFNLSASTNWVPSFVGKVNLNFGNSAASTPTVKGFAVYEQGANITPVVTVAGSVLAEGGTYIAYNLTTASFTVGGTTIYAASGSAQAGYMYFLQDPIAVGAAHAATSAWGSALPMFSSNSAISTTYIQANGTFAAASMYQWNLGVAPTVAGIITSGISSLNGGYTVATYGTSTLTYLSIPSPTALYYTQFTISSLASAITAGSTYTVSGITVTIGWNYATGSLGIVGTSTTSSQIPTSGTLTLSSGSGPATISYTAISQVFYFNGYILGATPNDQVVLMAGTAAVPSGLTAWATNTLQTTSNVYFTRDVQLVYNFSVPGGIGATAITAAATYTVTGTGVTLTASIGTAANATTVILSSITGNSIPASGTLTLSSGSGPATITYASFTSTLYFNVSATSGGALVAATSTNTGFSMMRAFGISTNTFMQKTGTLSTTIAGTLVPNTMNYCKPISTPANTTLQGQDCIAFQASAFLYMFKISDIASLVTTWPSLLTAGVANTGTGLDVVTPTAAFGEYCGAGLSGEFDKFVYVTNTSTLNVKPYQVGGSAYTATFGSLQTGYYAGQNPVSIAAGLSSINGMHVHGGLLFICSQATGQTGIAIIDMGSDAIFGYSGVISPVQTNQPGSQITYMNSIEQDYYWTGENAYWIRTGASSSDSAFSSGTLPSFTTLSAGVSNGWTLVSKSVLQSSISLNAAYQLCATTMVISTWPVSPFGNGGSGSPAQIQDFFLSMLLPGESVDDLAPDIDNSTQGTATPNYFAWQVVNVPATLPTNLVIYGFPVGSNAQNVSDSFTSNPSRFQYYNGSSWQNLSTISQLFTLGYLLRYNNPTPPGVKTQMAVRYS